MTERSGCSRGFRLPPVAGKSSNVITRDRVLAARYEVGELIGRGGMAAVYRGRDRVLDRTVAIKVLSPALAADPAFVTRFRREAQAAARLSYPSVVAVFDTGSDDDDHFIVMEFVEGRTLAEILRDEGPLSPERALRIGEAAASGLAFAHRGGLVHRDVKPANVMVTPSGGVKVMDFGIARAGEADRLTVAHTVMGTAAYLSPEQAAGGEVDGRADVYALGVVLFEMLTGRPPFEGDNLVSVAYRQVHEAPVAPSSLRPGLPAAMDPLVLRALAKDPARRYATAEEFGAAMGAVAAGGGVPVTHPIGAAAATEVLAPQPVSPAPATQSLPVSPAALVRTPRRRWPWLVFGLVVVAGLFGGAFLLSRHTPVSVLPSPRPSVSASPSPSASPRPSPSPSPSSSASPTARGVQGVASAVRQLIERGVSAGTLSDHVAHDLDKGLSKALDAYAHGDLQGALHAVDDAQHKISEARDHGDITTGSEAAALHQAFDRLASVMRATPPP